MNDSLETLEGLLPELPRARQADLFGEALQEAGRQLGTMAPDVGRLEEWQHSVGLLGEFWDGDEEREVLDALHRLRSFGEQIEAAQDREQLARVSGIAIEAKQKITIALRDGARAWARKIDHDLGSLGSLGALLAQFQDTRDLGRRMAALTATASTLRNAFPPSSDALEKHRIMLHDADEIRKSLAAIGAGQSVQTFLIAVADETATLDMVDETVLQWIRARRAENRFRLLLKRGISA